MCGRFTQTTGHDGIAREFPDVEIPASVPARYNIAPTQDALVVVNGERPYAAIFRWGLVPHWAKDTSIGSRMINARAETIAEKPSFREPYAKMRCIVVADGFYEWRREPGGTKTPMYIRMTGGGVFGFAGLWDEWGKGDETLRSFTIITTTANELVANIHDRMPAIIPRDCYARWLSHSTAGPGGLDDLLAPYPSDAMEAYEVSHLVNKPEHDSPSCITPVA